MWAKGNLAVCVYVEDIQLPDGRVIKGGKNLVLDRIYRVAEVRTRIDYPSPYDVFLEFEEYTAGPKCAMRFRKLNPDHSDDGTLPDIRERIVKAYEKHRQPVEAVICRNS